MPNPTNCLKVPKQLFKIANKADLLNEVMFYYELKRINKEGFFKRGQKIALFQKETGLSASRIQQLIASCVELGFLRRSKGTLSLCSYNHLWSYFKISLSGLKLLKVTSKQSHYSVKDLIQCEMLRNKIKGIEKKLPKAYVKCLESKGLIKSDTVSGERATNIFNRGKKLAQSNYFESIRKNLSSYSPYCTESTITSSKIADMFGYKSPMQGHNIQKRLEEVGLITVERNRRLFISAKMNSHYHRSIVSSNNDSSFFYTSNNKYLLKQLPNIMSFV